MENVLSLTPGQQIFIVIVNAWMFVIFPVLVLRKLNYISSLLETQMSEDDEGDEESGTFGTME